MNPLVRWHLMMVAWHLYWIASWMQASQIRAVQSPKLRDVTDPGMTSQHADRWLRERVRR